METCEHGSAGKAASIWVHAVRPWLSWMRPTPGNTLQAIAIQIIGQVNHDKLSPNAAESSTRRAANLATKVGKFVFSSMGWLRRGVWCELFGGRGRRIWLLGEFL
jgi:hypothetical protein